MAQVNPDFLDKVNASDEFNATACMNCGVCSAVCPMEIELLPRKLFRYVTLGLEEKVLEHTQAVAILLYDARGMGARGELSKAVETADRAGVEANLHDFGAIGGIDGDLVGTAEKLKRGQRAV